MNERARATEMFLNTPLEWRKVDVRTTERYAADLKHYRPRVNDWPGVDDYGADHYPRNWEIGVAVNRLPHISDKARDTRRVIGHVNWYGDDVHEQVVEPEPRRTWELDDRMLYQYSLLDLLEGSLLYRSEPEDIAMNSTPVKQWYTSRAQAITYNDVHFNKNDTRHKAVFPFHVYKTVPLLDMNDAKNIKLVRSDILRDAKRYADSKIRDELVALEHEFTNAFPVDATGVVGRVSFADVDERFCIWFMKEYRFGGWIYQRSDVNPHHHDEIFISNPSEYLVRGSYVVREVREQSIKDTTSSSTTRQKDADDDLARRMAETDEQIARINKLLAEE